MGMSVRFRVCVCALHRFAALPLSALHFTQHTNQHTPSPRELPYIYAFTYTRSASSRVSIVAFHFGATVSSMLSSCARARARTPLSEESLVVVVVCGVDKVSLRDKFEMVCSLHTPSASARRESAPQNAVLVFGNLLDRIQQRRICASSINECVGRIVYAYCNH